MQTTNNTNNEFEMDLFKPLRQAFGRQRASAKFRGIEFKFSFETWLGLWLSSGFLDQRGKGPDKYVMSRYNDTGPYCPENCFIQTFADNVKEVRAREAASKENHND